MASTPAYGQVGPSGPGQTLTVDLEALFKELERVEDAGEGMTTEEVCEAIKRGTHYTRKLIRAAIDAGKCRPARVSRMGIDKVWRRVSGYIFEV